MSYLFSQDLLTFIPEIFFICCLLSLILWILPFSKSVSTLGKIITHYLVILVVEVHVITILLLTKNFNKVHVIFYDNFISDNYTISIKIWTLSCTILFLSIAKKQIENRFSKQLEFIILLMFAVFALCVLISSNDLITLYLSVELQSLCLYVLTSFDKDSQFSSEAGLKYFILGALSSSILLFGLSLIYGTLGHTNYHSIAKSIITINQEQDIPHTLILGLILLISAFFFKLTAVPFHIWSPDVYEGVPFAVLIFLATIPKLSFFSILIKLLYVVFFDLYVIWQPLLMWTAFITIGFSSIVTLYQKKIKRFLAYSSINHVGYILVGLASGTLLGLHSVFFYLFAYLTMIFAFFGLLALFPKNLVYITDLLTLRNYPFLKFLTLGVFFSMAGLPPLLGFFSKFYIILAAIESHYYFIMSLIVGCSVISAFYYLRIIKVIQFEIAQYTKMSVFQKNPIIYLYLIGSFLLLCLYIISPNFFLVQTYHIALWL